MLEDTSSLASVITNILSGALELISCQACRVLVVDSDPPGVRITLLESDCRDGVCM